MRRESLGQFTGRSEIVACAADEEGGGDQERQMPGAEFGGLGGRMERIAENQESAQPGGQQGGQQGGLFGSQHSGQHGGLASAVGMATREERKTSGGAERGDGGGQTGTVSSSARGVRWPGWPLLAKRQIDAQHRPSLVSQGGTEGNQQGRIRVGSGTVGEHQRGMGISGLDESFHRP